MTSPLPRALLTVLAIAMTLPLVACKPEEKPLNGYVEGEFVMVAPTSSGLLQTLAVQRGQTVAAGAPLFSLDLTDLTARRDSAAAAVRQARAQLDDLLKGKRPEEIDIILQQKQQAEVALTNARQEYARVLPLSKSGMASLASRDDARAALDSAKARLAELNAELTAAGLGARTDQITAAEAALQSAGYALIRAEKTLDDAAPMAPAAGTIDDTFFEPGEFIAAGQPVVSLLPPEQVKIRFYVPQRTVPTLKPGQPITIRCDGCGRPIAAHISHIASESEYTPPVIYSVESRDKLVFLIEAKPDRFDPALRPGLPVDIDLEP